MVPVLVVWSRVPAPDGDQSFQTTAEKWAQSDAIEINSRIQSGAMSPIHEGPMPSERKKSCRHMNQRFHWLRNNYNYNEADFFTKQLPTPLLYEQARRDLEANESSCNWSSYEISGQITPKSFKSKANTSSADKT
jgi:hypothetical protein